MLPQVAMGHSQSAIIAMAHFENEILDISSLLQTKAQKEEAELKRQSAKAS